MAKDIDEQIGARSQKICHVLKYKNPSNKHHVHEMPTGDHFPPALVGRFEHICFQNMQKKSQSLKN